MSNRHRYLFYYGILFFSAKNVVNNVMKQAKNTNIPYPVAIYNKLVFLNSYPTNIFGMAAPL